MADTEAVELLPCPTPWCDRWTKPYVFERRKDILGVCCPVCNVSTPYFATEAEAITAWNTRTPPTDVEAVAPDRVAACCLPGGVCYEAGLADVQHKADPLVARVADALADHISAEPQVREDIASAAIAAMRGHEGN